MANCSQVNNTTIKGTSAFIYDGTPLPCTDIKTCDDLNTVLAKLDTVVCNVTASVDILKEEVTNITEDVMIIGEDIIRINNQLNICCPTTTTTTTLFDCNFTGTADELNCNFIGTANQVPGPTTTTTSSSSTSSTTTTTTTLSCQLAGNGVITVPPTSTTTTSSSSSTSSTTTTSTSSTTTTTTTNPCPNCTPSLPIAIGTQEWTNCNLNVATYRNGDTIPQVTDPTAWSNLTTGAWCYMNNDPANEAIYGKLYNWFAVNDPRGLAPTGYHVPSDTEWTTLINYLGGLTVAGGAMKETGVCHFIAPNNDATNSSGFTGLPGGYRYHDTGGFNNLGYFGFFWSSLQSDVTSYAWGRYITNDNDNAIRNDWDKGYGFSIRLIKD